MGAGLSFSVANDPSLSKSEMTPGVFKILHYDLQFGALHLDREDTSLNLSDAELYDRIGQAVQGIMKEADLPLAECRCPAVVLFKFQELSDEQKEEFAQAVFEAALKKDIADGKIAEKAMDYSKTFGGTEADHKAEQEAAAMLRGDEPNTNNDAEILIQPNMIHPSEHTVLRLAGKWKKFLSTRGCYLYIHSLTRDLVAVKPDDYIDLPDEQTNGQNENSASTDVDPSNGLPTIPMSELPTMVDHIVKVLQKTPLIIDTSPTESVRTYYSYKANVADVSSLVVPYGKSGVKKEDLMERCRHTLVSSMKKGQLFVLYLGGVTIEHADFKTKLCKKDVFPKDVFINAGKKLLEPDYDPKYKQIYREEDLESGQAVVR
eukprot:scaffold437_cov168-Ochromonas_danica.AAC.26